MNLRPGRLLGGGVNTIAHTLAVADFRAPLRTSLVPIRGTGAPTFTRATTGTVVDHEGVVRTCLVGEARFTGARRVQNLLTNTATPVTQNVATTSGVGAVSVSGTGSCFITGASAGVILPSGPVYTNNVNRAWLCDATAETVTGAELVTNGTFATDTTGWNAGGGATLSVVSGALRVTNGASTTGYAYQTFSTVTGKQYVAQLTRIAGTATGAVNVGLLPPNGEYAANSSASSIAFTATSTNFTITCHTNSSVSGAYCDFDNVSVRLAEPDRSVKNKPLPIYGSLTKTLVGGVAMYSGFSASDYLEEAYSADWGAIGTGDFCIIGWAIPDPSGTDYMMEIGPVGDTSTARIECYTIGNVPYFYIKGASGALSINSTSAVPAGVPFLYVAGVRSGSSFLSINVGTEVSASAAAVGSLSNSAAVLRIGKRAVVPGTEFGGSLALWRISATAPSADQIGQIYRDELTLFQTPTGNRKQVTIPLGAGTTKLTFVGSNSDAQVEDVTAQSIQAAGEYVSVGVLSSPYHGTGVDGVKCFDTTLAGVPIPTATLKGYLAEGTRTNLLLRSQDFNSADWTKTNTTISADAIAAPDGTLTADKIVETATNASHRISQAITKAASALPYTGSVYLKQGERAWALVFLTNTAETAYWGQWVNLATGAKGAISATGFTSGSMVVTSANNGFYRCEATATTGTEVNLNLYVYATTADNVATYVGDITKGIYAWGAQLEAGPTASSYIPTTTIAVTRNADVLTYPSAGNILGTAGSAYAEVAFNGLNASTPGRMITVNSAAERNVMYNPSYAQFGMFDGTSILVQPGGVLGDSVTRKYTSAWGGATMKVTSSGAAVTSGAFDGDMNANEIRIGSLYAAGYELNGNISNVCIWTRKLPDAILKRISK